MNLQVKKLYTDSKYKNNDSISNSHFKVSLQQTLELPEHAIFKITGVCIPHSWYTIIKKFK